MFVFFPVLGPCESTEPMRVRLSGCPWFRPAGAHTRVCLSGRPQKAGNRVNFLKMKSSSCSPPWVDYLQEMEVLRKQVECLAEENGKLLGHQNPNQKIHYVVRLRRENVRLAEVNWKSFGRHPVSK